MLFELRKELQTLIRSRWLRQAEDMCLDELVLRRRTLENTDTLPDAQDVFRRRSVTEYGEEVTQKNAEEG